MSKIVTADIAHALNSKSGVLGIASQIKMSDNDNDYNVAQYLNNLNTSLTKEYQAQFIEADGLDELKRYFEDSWDTLVNTIHEDSWYNRTIGVFIICVMNNSSVVNRIIATYRLRGNGSGTLYFRYFNIDVKVTHNSNTNTWDLTPISDEVFLKTNLHNGRISIIDSSITTDKLHNTAVTRAKIEDGAIDSTKLYNGPIINTNKLIDKSVTEAKLDDSVAKKLNREITHFGIYGTKVPYLVLSEDTSVVEGKRYYTSSYVYISNPTGNPHTKGYYEADLNNIVNSSESTEETKSNISAATCPVKIVQLQGVNSISDFDLRQGDLFIIQCGIRVSVTNVTYILATEDGSQVVLNKHLLPLVGSVVDTNNRSFTTGLSAGYHCTWAYNEDNLVWINFSNENDTTNVSSVYSQSYRIIPANNPIYSKSFVLSDGAYIFGMNTNKASSVSDATDRGLTTRSFNPFLNIAFYGGNDISAANEDVLFTGGNYLRILAADLIDLRLNFNLHDTSDNTDKIKLEEEKPLYLVLVPQNDGLVKINTANPLSQTLPSTDDGYIYKLLGILNLGNATPGTGTDGAYRMYFNAVQPVYWYKDGEVRPYTGNYIENGSVSTNKLETSIQNSLTKADEAVQSLNIYDIGRPGHIIIPVGTAANMLEKLMNIKLYVKDLSGTADVVVTHIKQAYIVSNDNPTPTLEDNTYIVFLKLLCYNGHGNWPYYSDYLQDDNTIVFPMIFKLLGSSTPQAELSLDAYEAGSGAYYCINTSTKVKSVYNSTNTINAITYALQTCDTAVASDFGTTI